MQLLFSFDRGTRVEKTLMQTLASQLSCNSCSRAFDRGMRVEKTLMQTLASQLSSTLILVWPGAGNKTLNYYFVVKSSYCNSKILDFDFLTFALTASRQI
jgi:hypothetical protein